MALSVLSLPLMGQEYTEDHINKVDNRGRRQGHWKVYDGIGELKFQGNFVNGKPMGEFVYYYPNGQIKAKVLNIDSGRADYTRMFYPNTKLMAVGKHSGQKKDSIWLYYSEEGGSLLSDELYIDGKKEGVWRTYYPDGKVAEEVTYKEDVREGPWNTYFSTGEIKSTCAYHNDLLEGRFIIYHLNGKVEVSGAYHESKKLDVWVFLTDLGELVKKEYYRNGILVRTEEPGTNTARDE